MASIPARRLCPALLLVAAAMGVLNACALVQVDADGQRQVRGWVWLTLPPEAAAAQPAATALRARAVGLVITRSPAGSAAVLGYSDSTVLTLPPDSAVQWPPPPPTSPASPSPQGAASAPPPLPQR
jgi:predicted outer membrane lipoprotein